MTTDLLGAVLAGKVPTYALLHRPERAPNTVEVLAGEVTEVSTLAAVPLPDVRPGTPGHDTLVLIPYRQLAERGFPVNDDAEPMLAMTVAAQQSVPVADATRRLPDEPVRVTGTHFDVPDAAYAELVRAVVDQEIGTGEGANFVIKRTLVADITGYSVTSALSFFHRLLRRESGAYWTFLVHTGSRTFVGATPERHVSVSAGTATMNPISGTYRYPRTGADLSGLLDFLADPKETEELYMVVDEELKMMARFCDTGGRVVGPRLKEMAHLAHTEYLIEGETTRDVRDILRETMFAPTVTGSPLENACAVIRRHEPHGRSYYSGVIALIGHDGQGRRELDSSILIRTADIDARGRVRIGVGATLVRHSRPESEVAETTAKAAGLLAALGGGPVRLADHPEVHERLRRRHDTLARFWFRRQAGHHRPVPHLAGRRVLIVDAEDTFTSMIRHQLVSLGMTATVARFDAPHRWSDHDLVVLGPGPGDPRRSDDPKIARLDALAGELLHERRPLLAVCLSHQILCRALGVPLVRRHAPNQGVQRTIDLFGRQQRVGFYNTFVARSDRDRFDHPRFGAVELSREPVSGEVHALRGGWFAGMQFHAESILTEHGSDILAAFIRDILAPRDAMAWAG